MTGMTPEQMAAALGKGLLSFPVTNFGKGPKWICWQHLWPAANE
jgi:hypothetical protein